MMTFKDVSFISPPCLCGCDEYKVILDQVQDTLHQKEGTFKIVKCSECALIRTSPQPTPETIEYYYPQEYAPYHIKQTSPNEQYSKTKRWLHQHFFAIYDKPIPAVLPTSMLEIGCANGVFLKKMAETGWDVTGIEFSVEQAEVLAAEGFEVHAGSFLDIDLEKKYDFITAWMVLEHLHKPDAALKKIHTLLNQSGTFAFSVPDIDALNFKLFKRNDYALHIPGHLFHFNKKSISELLLKHGFIVEKVFFQANPNNLLKSCINLAQSKQWNVLERNLQDAVKGNRYRVLVKILALLMRITHQSGRMSIWAKKI